MINCTYPEIKGGVNAIIEEDSKILAHQKFTKLNDAVNWTNAWTEGYNHKKENKVLNESIELAKQINKRFQNNKERIDSVQTETKYGPMTDILFMTELHKLRMDSVALEMKLRRINGK